MGVTMRVTRALRSARKAIDQENRYAASNYASLPVVINRCQGVHMYDCDGKEYFDFLSAYSAVNQGHCHPGIMQAAVEQLQTCHLTSRAFHNDKLSRANHGSHIGLVGSRCIWKFWPENAGT